MSKKRTIVKKANAKQVTTPAVIPAPKPVVTMPENDELSRNVNRLQVFDAFLRSCKTMHGAFVTVDATAGTPAKLVIEIAQRPTPDGGCTATARAAYVVMRHCVQRHAIELVTDLMRLVRQSMPIDLRFDGDK